MSTSPTQDTIAAISTPPGRGGIGIVRLAGPEALSLAARLLWLPRSLEHARPRFTHVLDPRNPEPDAPPLDQAVVTAYLAPRSYTGDDLVEIAAHGSPVVLDAILTAALTHGARLADPGEFTQRAFLAGKLDLTQAEAVHDLIAAQTLEQARAAAGQLGGALSRRVAPAKEALLHLIALLEAGMDFASGELDDVDVVSPAQIAATLADVSAQLSALERSYRSGALLRAGVSLALVGRPNAGKSSLFNRLLERSRAIVTPIPGTTRDTVEESWSLQGIPVRLVDTAGLRLAGEMPADEAERQGMERSREVLADADLVLLVHDATVAVSAEELQLAESLEGRPHLLVRNKADLLPHPPPRGSDPADGLPVASSSQPAGHNAAGNSSASGMATAISVSALTGAGLPELRSSILAHLQAGAGLAEAGALTNRRHQAAIEAALASLQAATQANNTHLPHELLLMDLHQTLTTLDTLTGTTTPEDILTRIFSTFCIGK